MLLKLSWKVPALSPPVEQLLHVTHLYPYGEIGGRVDPVPSGYFRASNSLARERGLVTANNPSGGADPSGSPSDGGVFLVVLHSDMAVMVPSSGRDLEKIGKKEREGDLGSGKAGFIISRANRTWPLHEFCKYPLGPAHRDGTGGLSHREAGWQHLRHINSSDQFAMDLQRLKANLAPRLFAWRHIPVIGFCFAPSSSRWTPGRCASAFRWAGAPATTWAACISGRFATGADLVEAPGHGEGRARRKKVHFAFRRCRGVLKRPERGRAV